MICSHGRTNEGHSQGLLVLWAMVVHVREGLEQPHSALMPLDQRLPLQERAGPQSLLRHASGWWTLGSTVNGVSGMISTMS